MQNRFLKSQRYSQVSIAVLVTGIAMLFFSCANKVEKIKEFSSSEQLPGMEAENFEMIYSDSTIVRFKLKTPKLVRYEQEKDPFTEFPNGVEIEKFNEKMEIVSVITADYAQFFEKEEKWIAKNNVVAVNQQGDSLKTEELIWDDKKGKIYSEQFVKIISKDKIINGVGFESDQNMTNWEIKKIRNSSLYLEVAD